MLSMMDHTGHFIYVQMCLGRNDRAVLTSSPLYLLECNYFSDNEWVLSDGAFDGDGRFLCSYKNPENDPVKIRYNLAFWGVRQGEANSYQRISIWFPILGNNKKNFYTLKKFCFQQSMLLQDSIIPKVCLTLHWSHLKDYFIVIIKSCNRV
jgi:hypothetical protein